MATAENLRKEELTALENFFKENIEPVNKEATFTRHIAPRDILGRRENDPAQSLGLRISKLEEQVSELTTYLKLIFDGHVLIDGQFRKI